MRPLTLHASALNDFEYGLYTSSLHDLCVTSDSISHDDAHYENMTVGVREARAWLRGRYQDLPASDVDDILKLFFPNVRPGDTLTGGQFFAAHRLVVHAQSGKGTDRSLAFIQALPEDIKSNGTPRPPAPPSHPDRSKAPTCNAETNPFARRSVEDSSDVGSAAMPPRHKISYNPFLMRDKVEAADSSEKGATTKSGKLPPLPPRKPTNAASLQRPSEVTPALVVPCSPPLVPIKPNHITSPLMRQSLAAGKHGKTAKRAEEQLERERVLQVLKSTTASGRARSLSPSKRGCEAAPATDDNNAGPRRRQPSSASSSASSSLPSLDRIAGAALKPPPPPPPLPSREHASPIPAPPTHPDRRPCSTDDARQPSPTSSRVFRSRSMHHADAPPLPPPRRKRPESVQLTTMTTTTDISSSPSHSRTASLSRRVSLTRQDSSPMSNIQKTISNLQLKAQPRLDAVRYKAEAGLSRRGYVSHSQVGPWRDEGERGLMEDTRWTTANVDSGTATDDEPGPWDDRGPADNLKWPAGEGWAPL